MGKFLKTMALPLMITGALIAPVFCPAESESAMEQTTAAVSEIDSETSAAAEDKSDLIAGADERITVEEVGWEGMEAVKPEDLAEGTYENITVDSSSAMFRIIDCDITVAEGAITAVVTLSGSGYSKLFMGTGAEAVELSEDAYVPYVEDENGKYTFTVPVAALDQELECTSWSVRKEKWYDHQVVFESDQLPDEAFLKGRPVRETETDDTKKSKLVIAGQEETEEESQTETASEAEP